MGRKPVDKTRSDNPRIRTEMVEQLQPYIAEHGLKLSMDEIAQVMGKSKATVYKYFESRDQIIEYTLIHKMEELAKFKDILEDGSLSILDRYFKAIQYIGVRLSIVNKRLLLDLEELYPNYFERIEDYRAYTTDIWKDFYQKGIDEGIFYPVDPYVVAVMDRMFFKAIIEGLFFDEKEGNIKKALEEFFKLKLHGLIRDTSKLNDVLLVPGFG